MSGGFALDRKWKTKVWIDGKTTQIPVSGPDFNKEAVGLIFEGVYEKNYMLSEIISIKKCIDGILYCERSKAGQIHKDGTDIAVVISTQNESLRNVFNKLIK